MKKNFKVFVVAGVLTLAGGMPALSAESWQKQFEDICSHVDASGSMSTKELADLVDRANKLAPEIQASSDRSKKVYLRRLKNCRAMYEFVIETKK